MRRLSSLLTAFLWLVARADVEPELSHHGYCEKIEDSPLPEDDHNFNFFQHDERLDPNKFVKVVFKILSQRQGVDPIKKVQLDYNPILPHLVGRYSMRSTVSHLRTDGSIEDSCYDIVIQIHDTDECLYAGGNPEWTHECDPSSQCVNTKGGYFCGCRDGDFALPGSGNGKCTRGHRDSVTCCGEVTFEGADSGGDAECRRGFTCHSDACAFNECDPNAVCVPAGGLDYSCECRSGFRDVGGGDGLEGRRCEFVDRCLAPNPVGGEGACPANCDCQSVTNSEVDGFYCTPREGFEMYYPTNDYEWVDKPPQASPWRLDRVPHLCVSQIPPDLELVGPNPMVLTQGREFDEPGVKFVDESLAELKRRFTTDYSNASTLMDPSGFAKECGEQSILYTLSTPWVRGHTEVEIRRKVKIVDVDECTYDGPDPDFRHTCQFPARCQNFECGTSGFSPGQAAYMCVCDKEEFEPDGANGCQRIKPKVVENECVPRLVEAFKEIQWCFLDLTAEQLAYYKMMIKKVYDLAWFSEAGTQLPLPYEWDKPYRPLTTGECRELVLDRELASPMQAATANKAQLVALLAHRDYEDFAEAKEDFGVGKFTKEKEN